MPKIAHNRKTHAQFMEQVEGRPFDVLGDYAGTAVKLQFRCHIDGNVWSAEPLNILRGTGCPVCGFRTISEKQIKTNEVLEDHGDWLLIDISTPKYTEATMAVDTDDWNTYEGGRVSAWAKVNGKYIYGIMGNGGKTSWFHRVVLPKIEGLDIDHIRHGSMTYIDNRRSNLRHCTLSQNAQNKSKYRNNTSGITGVFQHKETGKWGANIRINGRLLHLGQFDRIDFAEAARIQAEKKLFGEYTYRGKA